MLARIFQPARNAMQSGQAKTKVWILEFAPEEARKVDPLMGWTSSGDTQAQVHLTFDSRQDALDYAEAKGFEVSVADPHPRRSNIRPGGYGDNFATSRRSVWTH